MRNQLLADDCFSMLSPKMSMCVSPLSRATEHAVRHQWAKLSSCKKRSGVKQFALSKQEPSFRNAKEPLANAKQLKRCEPDRQQPRGSGSGVKTGMVKFPTTLVCLAQHIQSFS